MYGRDGEIRKGSGGAHMCSTPKAVVSDSQPSVTHFFCKAGRRISVGDTALFKPPQDSPPFIGIIRWFSSGKENNYLQLGVNWLYRHSEVKLGKGLLLDAAPNEIFYSFHADEIPAASLLHPCKVAFLPKGVELPPGTSSFVCRRVYDISNKRLWWLTDQDYIDERQEEVDQLLYKTRTEMHATVQPGGRSPKPVMGLTSTSQSKPGSDNLQTSANSFPSQVKRKKKEQQGDQGSEPVKRERSSKKDDGDSGQYKAESILRSEISKFTEEGGLVNYEGVEQLVQLMQPDKAERKMDLISRSMLAGVIAATDKFDCLSRFVQLRGLPILDEWLQDIQKGRTGDGSSPKDVDKSVEEFLLVLLRALDKLPVNLHALQMCNIGRSVNHLRTIKNLEIQKKARSLVDTWKKRVQAEMNTIDIKSGSTQAVSWSSKSRLPDSGNKHPVGSSEIAMKSSVTQLSASKTTSLKLVQGDTTTTTTTLLKPVPGDNTTITTKSTSSSPGTMKFPASPVSGKDGHPKISVGSASDLALTTGREEKSSSSSQSHNYSQSLSGKEDARSSTAGSVSVNKISSGTSRHRKLINGFPGPTISGAQRETGSSRTLSMHRIADLERLSVSGLTGEKTMDQPIVEGNNHKLIVKIPNRRRSPAESASGGSLEDRSLINSRASSPVLSEKHDQFDRTKEKSDACDAYRSNIVSDVNTESWQSNDFKDLLTGSDEGDVSPAAVHDEERSRKVDDPKKSASSSSGNELKSGNLREPSFTSINALIESCVKYSEANASMSVGDDVGMNLLASVAAGEMSKSDLVSPTDSPQIDTPIVKDTCTGSVGKSKSSCGDILAQGESHPDDGGGDIEKQGVFSRGDILAPAGEHNEHLNSSSVDMQPNADPLSKTCEKSDEIKGTASVAVFPGSTAEKVTDGEVKKQLQEEKPVVTGISPDGIVDSNLGGSESLLTEDKNNEIISNVEDENRVVEVSSSSCLLENEGENNDAVNERFDSGGHVEPNRPAARMNSERVERTDEEVPSSSGSGKTLVPGNVDEVKVGKAEETDAWNSVNQAEKQMIDHKSENLEAKENQGLIGLDSSPFTDQKSVCLEVNVDGKEVQEHHSGGFFHQKKSPAYPSQETEPHLRSRGFKTVAVEAEETEQCASVTADASSLSAARPPDRDAKLKFDLNEGFVVDDEKFEEPATLAAPMCSSLHLMNPLPFSVSSVSGSLPTSITVASAAKGPFVPPEDLLRSKGELGWKGSASTSAFRPAEPRKFLELPIGTSNISLADPTTSKHGRPLFNIDLNVPAERVLDDMASQGSAPEAKSAFGILNNCDLARNELTAPGRNLGGLDLDLNQVDEANDVGQYPTSSSRRLVFPLLPVKSTSSGGLPSDKVRRGFDLNNGPSLDDTSAEPSFNRHVRGSMQSQPPIGGIRMNSAETGNISSWFVPGNTYSPVAIQSILPDRGEKPFPIVAPGAPQRILGPQTGGNPFTPDIYRGSVLSSSPAGPFPSTPFQYPVFPFGTSFPLSSATFSGGSTTYMDSSSSGRLCFPAIHSQALGPATAVSSPFPRPYMVTLPDGSNNGGVENSRKWGRQGLDLNSGPGGMDIQARDEPSRLHVSSSQALAEEQARMFQVSGCILKRKEPEGGWDAEGFRYK